MPRANRCFVAGAVWHITQRCHQREFLLGQRWCRQRWIHWLFEAKRRYGLCVLNYTVTSNHVHVLVKDLGQDEIVPGMQLVAGRTAQEYNRRKRRRGAFWEDRYHATAVATDIHLARCLIYIDLNMVRAGVVTDPADWPQGGYHEIQKPKQRYRIVDLEALLELTGCKNHEQLRLWHRDLVDQRLADPTTMKREACWTEAVAVGHRDFVAMIEQALGLRAPGRRLNREDRQTWTLKEQPASYTTGTGAKTVR